MTQKRRSFSLEDKIHICCRISNGESNKELAKELNVSHSTISSIWKKKDEYKQVASSNSLKTKKLRKSQYNDVESVLLIWLKLIKSQNIPLSGPLLLTKANEFAKEIGETGDINKSWIQRFCNRNDIVFQKISGEAGSAPRDVASEWINTVWVSLQRKYNPDEIYNADETGLFYKLTPDKTLHFKGEKCCNGKFFNDRITILVCANMSGSDKKKLLVVGKSKNPRCFKGVKNLPVDYHSNKNAWMVSDIFNSFLVNWDNELLRKKKKVLLLIDNCPSHIKLTSLRCIEIVFFLANTSVMQPMDLGVFQKLKFNFRKRLILQIMQDVDKNRTTKISILDAILMVDKAWNEVPSTTIANCFRRAGLSTGEVQSDVDDSTLASWAANLNLPIPLTSDIIEEYASIDHDVATSEDLTEDEIVPSIIKKNNEEDKEEEQVEEEYDEQMKEEDDDEPSMGDALDSIRTLQKFLLVNNDLESDIIKQGIDSIEAKISHQYYIKKCLK